ncbi:MULTISPECIES: hypothetical protein [unclassified Brevundimonas]|uniref:hypothetical protein n=1 Tax=unclassified Brevundimonas TaxID=2622653 RepID=UPI0006F3F3C9|nr:MULTISPECIES: hypothetical protein [unclassified Brevundimonas]KQY90820.1 hypothetical protein ASD25_20085 [Brevundimonas sp. Root1423]KRA28472.1 hypothetical protein ASD59_01180 [Brevundimonas sp. Root608]
MTASNDVKTQDRGSLVLGTILSVPLFLVSFLVVAVVYYVVHTFMAGSVTDGVPRFVELTATVISSVLGVWAGRWVCDKAFKAWSGWPVFVLLVVLGLLNTVAIFQGYHDGVWQAVLATVQLVVACVAAWFMAVKKVDIH